MVSKYVFRQILSNIPVNLLSILRGFGGGWTSPMLYRLETSNFSLSTQEAALLGSVNFISRICGVIVFTLLIDRIGRAWCLRLCSLVYSMQWLILYIWKSTLPMIISRVMFGMTTAILTSTIPLFVAENTSPQIRGILTSSTTFSFHLGIFAVTILVLFMDFYSVHLIFLIVGLISLICVAFIKESPHFLIDKHEDEKAKENFFWLGASKTGELEKDYEEMKQNVLEEKEKSSIRSLLESSYIVKSLIIMTCTNFLMTSVGVTAITSYLTLMLKKESHFAVDTMMVIFAISQVVVSGLPLFFVDSFNRKTLLYIGCLLMILLQLTVASLYVINVFHPIDKFTYIIFSCLATLTSVYALLIFPINNCIRGEILPQSAKSIGSALGVSFSGLASFIMSYSFLPIAQKCGMATNFFIYALASFCLLIYVYFQLPETRGKSLIEIQEELKLQQKTKIVSVNEHLL